MMMSPCGVDCSGCQFLNDTCSGCREVEGKVYWAVYVNADICPIYDCSINKKQYSHCGECSELPCHIYYDTQDPETTKEEHEEGVRQRVRILNDLLDKNK